MDLPTPSTPEPFCRPSFPLYPAYGILAFLLLHTCFSRISCSWIHAEVMYWRLIHSAFTSCVSNENTAGYSRKFQNMADVRHEL